MAGVEDAAGAGRDGGVDAGAVQAHLVGGRIARRDEEHLLGALERVQQRRRVAIGAAPHADAAVGEVLRLRDVAHAHADLAGGDALQRVPHPPLEVGPVQANRNQRERGQVASEESPQRCGCAGRIAGGDFHEGAEDTIGPPAQLPQAVECDSHQRATFGCKAQLPHR